MITCQFDALCHAYRVAVQSEKNDVHSMTGQPGSASLLKWFCMAWVLSWNCVYANPPDVSYTSPLALKPGRATELKLYGNKLSDATQAWVGCRSKVTKLTSSSDECSSMSVEVAGDVTVGIYSLRLATRCGVSHPAMLMVDDLESIAEHGAHRTRETAQLIEFPCAVDGAGDGPASDFYTLRVQEHQSVTIEVVSERLGYALDARVKVTDQAGRTLAAADDSPGLGGDCRVRFRSTSNQQIFIEVGESSYSSSTRHKYRLRIGDFPLVSSTFPLAIQIGGIRSPSSNLPTGLPAAISYCAVDNNPFAVALYSLADTARSTFPVAAKYPSGSGSAMLQTAISPLPNIALLDYQPHDQKEFALASRYPVAFNGTFFSAESIYYYRLPLAADDRLRITGLARSLGSPADMLVKVLSPDGTQLASHDDNGLDEATFEFHAKTKGDYLLSVQEINRRFGPEYSYRVEITDSQPSFALHASSDRVIIGHGGVGLVPIQCKRENYTGPITLRCEGSTSHIRLENEVIAAGSDQTLLKLIPDASLQIGELQMLQLVGVGETANGAISCPVSIVEAIRTLRPTLHYPAGDASDQIAVSIAESLPSFYNLRLATESVVFPRIIGEAYFTVHCIDRLAGFSDPVQLTAVGLPNGFSTSENERPVGNSKNSEYRFSLRGPADFPAGKHLISVHGVGTFRGQNQQVIVAQIPFEVVEPLIVTLVAQPVANRPREMELRVSTKRFVPRAGGDRKEIHCTFAERPDWLRAPEKFVIETGKNEVTVPLTIASSVDSNSATTSRLTLTCETTVKGRSVKVASIPIEIEYPRP